MGVHGGGTGQRALENWSQEGQVPYWKRKQGRSCLQYS